MIGFTPNLLILIHKILCSRIQQLLSNEALAGNTTSGSDWKFLK